MPNYEYEVVNAASGEVLSEFSLAVPVDERDAVTLRRKAAPASIGIAGSARDASRPGHQVLEAYKRLEHRLGNNREFQRRIGHSPEQVRHAWGAH